MSEAAIAVILLLQAADSRSVGQTRQWMRPAGTARLPSIAEVRMYLPTPPFSAVC
jgi:hypothetical protein